MKKAILYIVPILLLLFVFPLLGSGALADLLGKAYSPVMSVLEPVNLLLFGIGLTFAGSRG